MSSSSASGKSPPALPRTCTSASTAASPRQCQLIKKAELNAKRRKSYQRKTSESEAARNNLENLSIYFFKNLSQLVSLVTQNVLKSFPTCQSGNSKCMNRIQVLLLWPTKQILPMTLHRRTLPINGEPWMILVTRCCIAIDSFHVNNEMHMVIFLPFLQTSYSSEIVHG